MPLLAYDDPAAEAGPALRSPGRRDFEEVNDGMAREMFGRIDTIAALPGVLAAVEALRPDVIVRETFEFAGALAAERYGIERVRVNLGLAAMEEWSLDLVGDVLDELRAGVGLRPDPRARRLRDAPSLTLVPRSLEDPAVPGGADLPLPPPDAERDGPASQRVALGQRPARLSQLRVGRGRDRLLPQALPLGDRGPRAAARARSRDDW